MVLVALVAGSADAVDDDASQRGRGIGVRLIELVNGTISGRIDVGAVSLHLPSTVVISDVAVRDPAGGVVARVERVEIDVAIGDLVRREVHAKRVLVVSPQLHLAPEGDTLNLMAAFQPRKQSDPNKSASGRVVLEDIDVRDAELSYDDGKGVHAAAHHVGGAATVD
ncbi:MAG TPA: hypothetical protein VGO62_00805, partial [Myxococcota bacterium]